MTWQRRAACRASPHLFDLDTDPPETRLQRNRRHGKAIGVCAACPVALECLTDSLENPHGVDGIRAGRLLENGIPA